MSDTLAPEQLWILNDCASDTIQQFLQSGKIESYPRGALCLRAGEDNPRIFFILDGKVSIYNLTKCGKKKILFILGRDHIANESVAGHSNTIFCEAMEPCRFYVISRKRLLALMEKDFSLTEAILRYQERKLWRLEHQLKNTVGSIYLERKLAAKLWKLARDFGRPTEQGIYIDLELSITFLADLLGAPRENASRACKKLVSYGLISMEKKKIYIPDPDKIAYFCKHAAIP